jgi:hypothetical protein
MALVQTCNAASDQTRFPPARPSLVPRPRLIDKLLEALRTPRPHLRARQLLQDNPAEIMAIALPELAQDHIDSHR